MLRVRGRTVFLHSLRAGIKMICVVVTISPLCADVSTTRILPVFTLFTVLVSGHPVQALLLHLYPLPSLHLLRLLCYLPSVEVDATVWKHGAFVCGWKLSIHVDIHLQESVCGWGEVNRHQLLHVAASLSGVMVVLLLGFLRHLQIQRCVVQIRLQRLQK